MINIPLNTTLSDLIRQCMREKGVTQKRLAEELDLPFAAVSKILKGHLIPSREQVEQIITCINPSLSLKRQLRALGAHLNKGLSSGDQAGTSYLRNLREKRGLSIPMLSNRTGIKTARLTELESSNGMQTTEAEKKVLHRVLEVSDAFADPRADLACRLNELDALSIPLLYLQDFEFYDHKKPLSELLRNYSREKIYWEAHTPNPPAAVLADCRSLQLSFPGFAVLTVADPPAAQLHQWELWCDKKGNYSLREFCRGAWYPARFSLPDAVIKPKRWSLPIYDFVFKPFNLTIGEQMP